MCSYSDITYWYYYLWLSLQWVCIDQQGNVGQIMLEQEAESLEKRVLCSPITYQSCAWILENGGIKWINHSRDYLSRSQQPLCTTISYCIRARAIRQILASAALRLDANIMMYSPHTNVITSLLHDHKCQSIVLALQYL